MAYHGYRNEAGVLIGIMQTRGLPTDPEKTAEVNRLAAAYGGTWQWIELDASQFAAALVAMQQFKAPVITGGVVVTQGPPNISSDKDQIIADGADTATLTFDVGNGSYNGGGKYWINPPETNSPEVSGALVFVGGVATKTLATAQIGIHQIACDVVGYGRAEFTVEGIA